jgi:hypothetical protein
MGSVSHSWHRRPARGYSQGTANSLWQSFVTSLNGECNRLIHSEQVRRPVCLGRQVSIPSFIVGAKPFFEKQIEHSADPLFQPALGKIAALSDLKAVYYES